MAVGLERGRDWRPQALEAVRSQEAAWARGEAWRLRKGQSEPRVPLGRFTAG